MNRRGRLKLTGVDSCMKAGRAAELGLGPPEPSEREMPETQPIPPAVSVKQILHLQNKHLESSFM